jgi:hypothetical protein
LVETLHTTINLPDKKIQIGQFYRKNNKDKFIGIKVINGDMGKPTRLYKVDISQIPRGYTFERTDGQ